MFGAIKTTAFRLAIAATIITGAFVCCTVFYFAVFYFIMPVLRQEAPIHFTIQQAKDSEKLQYGGVGFAPQPALYCHLPVDSAFTEFRRRATQPSPKSDPAQDNAIQGAQEDDIKAFSSLDGPYTYENGSLRQQSAPAKEQKADNKVATQEDKNIRMDSEFYQIEVVFEVAMTPQNYERGNLYIQAEFHSYKQGIKPLTLARSGYLTPKGSLWMNIQDLLTFIPFSSYFIVCEKTELVTIQIFEKFDNDDFGLESIEFLVPNEALQFKSPAKIHVKTALYGVRWFMAEWFFTCALACVCGMTFAMSLLIVITILVLKRIYLNNWL